MARLFGGASTDSITSKLTSHNTLRSYSIWAYRTGNGGGSFGRIFDKRTSGAGQVELFYSDPVTGDQYNRNWTVGQGTWGITRTSANIWNNFVVTYDAGDVNNKPIIYLNGVAQSLDGIDVQPTSGSANTNTSGYVIGNRTSDNGRNWAGNLCEFAVWNRILTPQEALGIGKGFSPAFYPVSLVEYIDLVREIKSFKLSKPTNSGTSVVRHPRIIYPRNFR